ncbi:polysaccharide biosynthesis protein [Planctomycetaceae bacterium SH139]
MHETQKNNSGKPSRLRQQTRRWFSRLRPIAWLAPLLACSLVAAYLIRFDGQLSAEFTTQLLAVLPVVVFTKTIALIAARITLSCHAFVSLHDAYRLIRGTFVATASVIAVDSLLLGGDSIPRGVVIIDGCLTALLLGGVLSIRRVRRERRERSKQLHRGCRTLIVGGPHAAELLLRAMRSAGGQQAYRAIGIITATDKLLHRAIAGVPVLGGLTDVADVVTRLDCQMIMLSSGDLPGGEVRRIMGIGQAHGREVRVVPDVSRIVSGQIDFKPREVAIEDLLGRPTVDIEQSQLQQWISGKRVLVTGSCGSIGSELVRQLLKLDPAKLVLVDRNENGQFFLGRELQAAIDANIAKVVIADATDRARMNSLFHEEQPQVVFHAAAYKHVPLMEQHPGEGVKNIIGATKNLADLSHIYDVESFVMISTDKAVNPTSVMGCCKRVAELYVQSMSESSGCRFVTVRFGNVLGSAGSVIPVFKQQIAAGGPVTVTDPAMTRFFMTIPEASQLVLQAAAMGKGGEIFVLDMGSPVCIMDLAEDMIRLSGLRLGHDIEIKISGLRPGEKLYEELYADDETRCATTNPKILKANCVRMSHVAIQKAVSKILGTTNHDRSSIYGELKQIVPSFNTEEPLQSPQAAYVAPIRGRMAA